MAFLSKLPHQHAESSGRADGDEQECMESVDSPAPVCCIKSLLCSCGEVLW